MASEFSSSRFADTSLRLGSINVLGPDQWSSRENNRKQTAVVGSESLVTDASLGSPFGFMGRFCNNKQANSVTSCTTVISKGDDPVDSPMNLNLDFGPCLGHDTASKDMTQLCKAHGGGKRCTFPGCSKGAEGTAPLCKGHGGGKRCSYQEGDIVCRKSVHGGTLFCVAHGGGKRCAIPECTKSARGRTSYCVRHGGGKRCNHEGCGKSAQGGTDFCKAHGGGKRCSWGQPGHGYGGDHAVPCYKLARGKIGLCAAHGAYVQDMGVRGDGTLSLLLHEPEAKKMNQAPMDDHTMIVNNVGFSIVGFKLQPLPLSTMLDDKFLSGPTVLTTQGSLPEGRVHGGGLMSLLQRHV